MCGDRSWDQLLKHLQGRAAEGLVQLSPTLPRQVSITVEGLEKVSSLSSIHQL